MKRIDSKITEFYNNTDEDTRLQIGLGPLEFERNKILIGQYTSGRPLEIADIGGGTGHYASWLARMGHKVTLVDPIARHLDKAKRKPGNFACILGEARDLPFSPSCFDLVILHGPLYHLQDQKERLSAIRETRRIIRPGGNVLGFAITHAASTIAALQTGIIHDAGIFEMCRTALLSGEHQAPEEKSGLLSSAYYHHPEELMEEFSNSSFIINGLFAVEGMAWLDRNFFQSWNDPIRKNKLLELVRLTEQDHALMCMSPHVMISVSPEI